MKRGLWRRENPSGVPFESAWEWLLLPGLVVQWFLYMFPTGGFAKVVSDTRVAKSPLMTYFISGIFYLLVLFILLVVIVSVINGPQVLY
jgi:hypothetical protein